MVRLICSPMSSYCARDPGFEPWRSEAEHAGSFPTILNIHEWPRSFLIMEFKYSATCSKQTQVQVTGKCFQLFSTISAQSAPCSVHTMVKNDI